MKEYIKGFLYLTVFLLIWSPTKAQQPSAEDTDVRRMTLQEVLELVEGENFEVRIAEAEMEQLRSRYRQTNATFLPQLSVEETAITSNDPLSVFGFKLRQESVSSSDFNPAILNSPDPYENFNTKFQLRQPLLNVDMLYRRSAVKNQLNAAKEQLEGTTYYARYRVKDAYYRLLLMDERLQVIDKSMEMAKENERQARNFYEQQIISKADYLSARVRLLELESQQSRVRDQLQTAQENLRYLLGMEEEIAIHPSDSLRLPAATVEELIPEAAVRNSELRALEYRKEAARQMVRSSKFSFLPSLNLFGSYEFNDQSLFGTRGESYMVGATLKWNLFDGFSKVGKVMESRAELKKAELAYQSRTFKNELEVRQAKRSLRQARKQLSYAESSVEQASEDFRIRSNRYEQDMEKTTDLLAAETKLAEARLQRLDALYQYNISLARLEMLFEQNLTYSEQQ